MPLTPHQSLQRALGLARLSPIAVAPKRLRGTRCLGITSNNPLQDLSRIVSHLDYSMPAPEAAWIIEKVGIEKAANGFYLFWEGLQAPLNPCTREPVL